MTQLWRRGSTLLRELFAPVVVVLFLVAFVIQAFKVEGNSMLPTLHDSERYFVDKLSYRLGAIRRGDIVALRFPLDPDKTFVKRVVGLPGELVELKRGVVLINGTELSERYLGAQRRGIESHPPLRIPPRHYYVLGDNRVHSSDSRRWGFVPERYLVGKFLFRYWPLGDGPATSAARQAGR
jgi:signal peptidase I